MPRHVSPRMSDEQTWILVTAPDEVKDRQLAAALGLSVSAVHARRHTLRTKGWTCHVRFATCLHCGESMTIPGSNGRTDRPYHPECSNQAALARNRAYRASNDELRRRMRQLGADYQAEHQEESRKTAVNHRARWTEPDDAWLAERLDVPVRELTRELGRTYAAVCARKRMLAETSHREFHLKMEQQAALNCAPTVTEDTASTMHKEAHHDQ